MAYDNIYAVLLFVILFFFLFLSARFLIKPGEKSKDHLKRRILDDQTKKKVQH